METQETHQDVVKSENYREDIDDESTSDEDTLRPASVHSEDLVSAADPTSLSKNQRKKLARKQKWEESRDDRKAKRREKLKLKKESRRKAKTEKALNHDSSGTKPRVDDGESKIPNTNGTRATIRKPPMPKLLPITFVFDCQFDELMIEGELISLGSQLTRCYSDNRKSQLRAHLAISSYGGRLKERFEGLLENHHKSWSNVRFLEDDWIQVAKEAQQWMKGPKGGVIAGALQKSAAAETNEDALDVGEVIYLSSESSETLTELKPYNTYIIGGLVDRNRYKGVCYERAVDAKVRTAKLPIGEFMQMNSRAVLATNHVCEIMLKWLEFGDWGKAFMEVIPKRKGGILKGDRNDNENLELEDEQDQNLSPAESTQALKEERGSEKQELTATMSGHDDIDLREGNLKRKHENSDDIQQDDIDAKRERYEIAS